MAYNPRVVRRIDAVQREKARDMRRTMTRSELDLWQCLSRKQLGIRFRRQHPIGPYIVDFAAVSIRLVVEVDGGTHADLDRESLRDQELHDRGWRVVHFTNSQIGHDLLGVLEQIKELVGQPAAKKRDRSVPPPRSGGG